MNFMKKHKLKIALLVILLLIFVVALVVFIKLLYPDSRKDVYGNRLEGIDKLIVSNQVITEIKDKIDSYDFVNDVDYLLAGRLINFIIEVKGEAKVEDVKKVVSHIVESFNSEIKGFYDIQTIIKVNEESEHYPMFAYKHKTRENFVWAKNK